MALDLEAGTKRQRQQKGTRIMSAEEKNKVTSNKAGSTHTTSREYIKREQGKNEVPAQPAENTGAVSPTREDLDNPEQRHDKPVRD